MLTESLVAKRLGQSRPDSKDALYQMLFELEQRGLKGTPEYRNVMFTADQHAEWLAGLTRLTSSDHALPLSSKETERTGRLTAPEKARAAKMEGNGLQPSSTGIESAPRPGERKAPSSRTKFTCVSCGQNVWGKPDARVDCHDCKVLMRADG